MGEIHVHRYTFDNPKEAWIAVNACGLDPMLYRPHCRKFTINCEVSWMFIERIGTVGRSPFEAMQRLKKLNREARHG